MAPIVNAVEAEGRRIGQPVALDVRHVRYLSVDTYTQFTEARFVGHREGHHGLDVVLELEREQKVLSKATPSPVCNYRYMQSVF